VRSLRREAGQSLVEFALASSMFFMTIFGLISFGVGVFRYNMVADLAQEGARWASVRGSGHDASMAAATEAEVGTYVSARAVGLSVSTSVFTVDASKVCTTTHTNPSALGEGSGYCVTVTNSFTPFTSLIPNAALTLQSTAQMVMPR
jgi:Flp pilus assembly protein TadG